MRLCYSQWSQASLPGTFIRNGTSIDWMNIFCNVKLKVIENLIKMSVLLRIWNLAEEKKASESIFLSLILRPLYADICLYCTTSHTGLFLKQFLDESTYIPLSVSISRASSIHPFYLRICPSRVVTLILHSHGAEIHLQISRRKITLFKEPSRGGSLMLESREIRYDKDLLHGNWKDEAIRTMAHECCMNVWITVLRAYMYLDIVLKIISISKILFVFMRFLLNWL